MQRVNVRTAVSAQCFTEMESAKFWLVPGFQNTPPVTHTLYMSLIYRDLTSLPPQQTFSWLALAAVLTLPQRATAMGALRGPGDRGPSMLSRPAR